MRWGSLPAAAMGVLGPAWEVGRAIRRPAQPSFLGRAPGFPLGIHGEGQGPAGQERRPRAREWGWRAAEGS